MACLRSEEDCLLVPLRLLVGNMLSAPSLFTEPGICHRNEDSRGNENRKSLNKIVFPWEKNRQAYLFFSMKIKVMDL